MLFKHGEVERKSDFPHKIQPPQMWIWMKCLWKIGGDSEPPLREGPVRAVSPQPTASIRLGTHLQPSVSMLCPVVDRIDCLEAMNTIREEVGLPDFKAATGNTGRLPVVDSQPGDLEAGSLSKNAEKQPKIDYGEESTI
ncbi:hypothetical protein Efla_004317 [Eimeria flavescens]